MTAQGLCPLLREWGDLWNRVAVEAVKAPCIQYGITDASCVRGTVLGVYCAKSLTDLPLLGSTGHAPHL